MFLDLIGSFEGDRIQDQPTKINCISITSNEHIDVKIKNAISFKTA